MYKMTNPHNVKIIVEKLLEFLRKTLDQYLAEELVKEISSLSEKFAPSPEWYIDVMNALVLVGARWVNEDVVQRMLNVITQDQGDETDAFTKHCANLYYDLAVEDSIVPDLLLQVMIWVLGEYGHLCDKASEDEITQVLSDKLEQKYEGMIVHCTDLIIR
jgi:vesicle coat complex subunit